MYLGIDIGGTKTLLGVLDNDGSLVQKLRFPTPQDYEEFMRELKNNLTKLTIRDFQAAGVGAPGILDRKNGIGLTFAHLKWKNVALQADLESLVKAPVRIENDAKLAGLSEAMLRKNISRLLYITISTGIGYALIKDQQIDTNIGDSGGSLLLFEHQGKMVPWESYASGKAIVQAYHQKAKNIHDPAIWHSIAHRLSQGFMALIAVTEPDLIIVGGSVGNYLGRYLDPLTKELKQFETPLLKIPSIEQAQRPDDAVLYGCYDLVHTNYE